MIAEFEKYVSGIMNNFSGIPEYSRQLGFSSEVDLVNALAGKNICDLGSGFDRFALDVILRGLNTTVVSINPDRNTPGFKARRISIIEAFRHSEYSRYTLQEINDALAQVDQTALAAFAHDLSIIPDETFDMVIDNKAVFHYSQAEYEDLYRRSILEIIRVTKREKRILIGDTCNIEKQKEPWYKKLFDELGLDYCYIEREAFDWERAFHERSKNSKIRTGFCITKH